MNTTTTDFFFIKFICREDYPKGNGGLQGEDLSHHILPILP